MKLVMVTNNSLINEAMQGNTILEKIIYDSARSHEDVLKISKGMIIDGHRLLINPLFGVIPPYEMPFKTLLLSEGGNAIDFNSLNIIDNAVKSLRKSNAERMKAIWDKNGLESFKKTDLVVIERWLTKIYMPSKAMNKSLY